MMTLVHSSSHTYSRYGTDSEHVMTVNPAAPSRNVPRRLLASGGGLPKISGRRSHSVRLPFDCGAALYHSISMYISYIFVYIFCMWMDGGMDGWMVG
jgi:hypothetical protein